MLNYNESIKLTKIFTDLKDVVPDIQVSFGAPYTDSETSYVNKIEIDYGAVVDNEFDLLARLQIVSSDQSELDGSIGLSITTFFEKDDIHASSKIFAKRAELMAKLAKKLAVVNSTPWWQKVAKKIKVALSRN